MHQPKERRGVRHDASPVTLHYAEQGDREGEAIVFLGYTGRGSPSAGCSPPHSRPPTTFAPDQRGRGDSDKPQSRCTADGFAADVDAFIEQSVSRRHSLVTLWRPTAQPGDARLSTPC